MDWPLAKPTVLRHFTAGRLALEMPVWERRVGEFLTLHVAEGTKFRSARAPDGTKQRSLLEWELVDVEWSGGEALHVVQATEWFSVICLWQASAFEGWHVNLQRPLVSDSRGWVTEDLALDVEVASDRSWVLRDEATFDDACALGLIDSAARRHVQDALRSVGERIASGAPPFTTEWTLPPPSAVGAL